MRVILNRVVGIILVLILVSWTEVQEVPKQFQKKINKAVIDYWEVEGSLAAFDVPSNNQPVLEKAGVKGIFILRHASVVSGYVVLAKARSKFEDFDYAIFYDQSKNIKGVRVLLYREDYGGEIASKRWLRQFEGKTADSPILIGNDIQGISGATISYLAITKGVKNITLLMQEI